jgi:putative ABC transport system substrate-binding protein
VKTILDFGLPILDWRTIEMNQRVRAVHSDSGNPKSKSGPADENPKCVRFVALTVTLALCVAVADAQQPAGKVWRIGFLASSSASESRFKLRLDALRQALRDLGHVEGKNINFEYRHAEGKSEQLSKLAEELVRLKVDILFAMDSNAAREAKKATTTIPIIITTGANPVESGLVASLARPGGNVTGLTTDSLQLVEKRLGLLKEVLPKVSRIAFLMPAESGFQTGTIRDMFNDAQGTAKILGVKFQAFEVKAPNPDFEGAFRSMVKERIGGLVTEGPPLLSVNRKKILELAAKHRIPAIHSEEAWANEGGLMSYGANTIEPYRRAAVFVDKIIKGTKPADLPVERPMKFEFVINLKTAKALDLTVPQSVLFRADKVIK